MKKIAIAAAALMLAGCAHVPQPKQTKQTMPRKAPVVQAVPVDQTPNQAVKKRWFPKFKVKWLHAR